MKWIKSARLVDCPTCGATPSRQKWKPRKQVDTDEMAAISEVNPVDAVRCAVRPRIQRIALWARRLPHHGLDRVRDYPTISPAVWRGLGGQMTTDTKEIAGRLRTEADYRRDYNEDDTLFN